MTTQSRRNFIAFALSLPFISAFTTTANAASTHKVNINGFAYSPSSLNIKVGDTVRWTNRDMAKHTASDVGKTWKTGTLSNTDSGKVTFSKAGTYKYTCRFHPKMKGRITVSV